MKKRTWTPSLLTFASCGFALFTSVVAGLSATAFAAPNFGGCDTAWTNCLVFASHEVDHPETARMTEFFIDPKKQTDGPGLSTVGGDIIHQDGSKEVTAIDSTDRSSFVIGTVDSVGDPSMSFARELTLAPEVTNQISFSKDGRVAILRSVSDTVTRSSLFTFRCPRRRPNP